MRIIARINLWSNRKQRQRLEKLVAFVTCLARRWKCLSFPRGLTCWVPRPMFRNCVNSRRERDRQLRLNVVNERLNVCDRPRFDSIWELWRLSNQSILIETWMFLYSRIKSIVNEDLNRPFTFIHSQCPSNFFLLSTPLRLPITMYQIDIMGRLTFAGGFLTSSRLRQSSNHLRREETILQLRGWTWIIASPTRINRTVVFQWKTRPKSIYCLLTFCPSYC